MKNANKLKGIKTYTLEQTFNKKNDPEFNKTYQEEKDRIRLARAIREAREEKKLTQEALAKKVAMPQSVISRLESGKHKVSLETLNKVVNAVGKKVEIVQK